MRLKGDKQTIKSARAARRDMSRAEVALWHHLRRDPEGLHFRRQQPADRSRLDFYCAKARLCAEVDGTYHDRGDRPANDEMRDQRLSGHGVLTLRVPAQEIFRNLEGVLIYVLPKHTKGCADQILHRDSGSIGPVMPPG